MNPYDNAYLYACAHFNIIPAHMYIIGTIYKGIQTLQCLWFCLYFTGTAGCHLAVVSSIPGTVTDVFLPNNTPIACDETSVVFLYTPQEEDWGKYLVKVYDNSTIANGHIYLESEFVAITT